MLFLQYFFYFLSEFNKMHILHSVSRSYFPNAIVWGLEVHFRPVFFQGNNNCMDPTK